MQAASDLAKDDTGAEVRREACSAYAGALAEVGQLLWITGSMLGPDRADGKSPFGFGSDDVVGLSVVCQVGGELARGFLDLFESGNLYSAQALLRQIVEVGGNARALMAISSSARSASVSCRFTQLNSRCSPPFSR